MRQQLSVFGRRLTLTLIARRSRHFAGTRYRRRGINADGAAANEVETEQILDAGPDWATGQRLWAAATQLRGSAPLFWAQRGATALAPRPDVELLPLDPLADATARHFAGLARRYGHPIVALNLLRARERRCARFFSGRLG